MPLKIGKVSGFAGFTFVSLFGICSQIATAQQTPPPINTPLGVPQTNTNITSAADVMRARIAKAKAFVAIKNYAAAIFELEDIKRESKDTAVNSVVRVMLMSCYLEQLDYKRAQKFLAEVYTDQKAGKAGTNYFAVAGQVVKSARNQLDRYKSLGLSISDISLPKEASEDVNKMRETVETVITQTKTLTAEKRFTSDAMALLEESTATRANLARDAFDVKRWKEEMADARDTLMNNRTTVLNAVEETPATANTIANTPTISAATSPNESKPIQTTASAQIPPVQQIAQTQNTPSPAIQQPKKSVFETLPVVTKTPVRERVVQPENNGIAASDTNTEKSIESGESIDKTPVEVGSLIEFATEKANPTYPPAARMMRKTGTVRVELVVDETGKIEDVKSASGEALLQKAALDAVKKWKFRPFMRDGHPVKAKGYVSFNFNL